MVLDLALVGTGGMMPLPRRWQASVLLRYRGHLILFDCGEGTQISLRTLGWGFKAIDAILISHVHGDHVAGVPGLLLTLGNAGRTERLTVLGPPGLTHVLNGLLRIAPHLPFELACHELSGGQDMTLLGLNIRTAAADHHVPCVAYRIDVPRARRFLPDRARELGVPVAEWSRLQDGQPWGTVQPDDVLGPPRRGVAVGLVTDTRPTRELVELVRGVDLLIEEGMYGDDADLERARDRKHMTYREAAEQAREAGVGELVLTHFSPSLTDPMAYLDNARSVFPRVEIGVDHLTRTLQFRDEDGR